MSFQAASLPSPNAYLCDWQDDNLNICGFSLAPTSGPTWHTSQFWPNIGIITKGPNWKKWCQETAQNDFFRNFNEHTPPHFTLKPCHTISISHSFWMKRTDNRNLSSKGALIWSLWPQVVRRAVEPLFSLGRYINRSKKAIFMFGVTILTVFIKLRKKGGPKFLDVRQEVRKRESSTKKQFCVLSECEFI